MPIATAPALLIGIGARILLDKYNRSDGPFIKDFILIGVWQGVALYYTTKASGTSGLGILLAFGIAIKLFIEFNLFSDVPRCVTTIFGVALGVVITDFLSQYFDKPPPFSPQRRRKKSTPTPAPQRHEKKRDKPTTNPHLNVAPSVTTTTDVTDLQTLATRSIRISDITSVDSSSDRLGPVSSMTALEREIHVLRTRAALADSERRRLKEERKWAISQGNLARASQMKWEVKRYNALMETFNREADLKALAMEASFSHGLNSNNGQFNDNGERTASTGSSPRSRPNGNAAQVSGHSSSSRSKHPSNPRHRNG